MSESARYSFIVPGDDGFDAEPFESLEVLRFRGSEGISEFYRFQIDLVATSDSESSRGKGRGRGRGGENGGDDNEHANIPIEALDDRTCVFTMALGGGTSVYSRVS